MSTNEPAPDGVSREPEPPPSPTLATAVDADGRRGLEAILFLADEPLDVAALAEAIEAEPDAVESELEQLAARYRDDGRGIEIRAVAGGWRMYTSPAAKPAVERWALAGRTGRLTQAALETLAVIAYKQPIGRQEIGDIRGVNADGAVRSLVARGFVEEVGRDPGPGQAVLYGTTRLLLERLGLGSIDQLPDLTDFLPEAPAPDEPELGALKEVRRRLAEGGELPSRSIGGRSAAQTNTGGGEDDPDDDEAMPAPTAMPGRGREDAGIDDLTERLERAARNAMDRLRDAVNSEDDVDASSPDEVAHAQGDAPGEGSGDAPPDGGEVAPAGSAEDERTRRG